MLKPAADQPGARRKGAAPFFISLMILLSLISLSPLSFGYQLVHYDSFDYNLAGVYLSAAGFSEYTGCGLNCTYTSGGELYLTPGAAISQISQKFNQVTYPYCLSSDGTAAGSPRNFSLRFKIRTQPAYSYTATDVIRNCIGQGSISCTGSTYSVNILYINQTGNTQNYVTYALSAPYRNYFQAYNTAFHSVQLDYMVNKSGANFYNPYVAGYFDGAPVAFSISSPSAFQCFNLSTFRVGNNIIYDDFAVIIYGDAEGYINANASLTGLPASSNTMPYYEIIQADSDGFLGSSAKPPLSMVFTAAPVADIENDTIYWGVDCGDYTQTIKQETFTASQADIFSRYDITANASIVFYTGTKQGIYFPASMNYTAQKFQTNFADDLTAYTLLSDSGVYGYSIDLDFKLGTNNRSRLQLYDFNNNLVYNLCLRQDNASGKLSYSQDCVNFATLNNFNFADYFSLRIFINAPDDSISFGLNQTNNLTTNYFYSPKQSITYALPIKSLYYFGMNESGLPANTGGIIGNYKVEKIALPALKNYASTFQQNCSSVSRDIGSYTATIFFTDTAHNGNWAYYSQFPYSISYISTNSGIDNAFAGDNLGEYFSAIFQGSDMLKYLFVIFVLAIITIGCVYFGSMGGSATMGFYAAAIFDCVAIFLFSLMGLVPTWIPVIIFLIAALLVAFLVMKGFNVGGVQGGAG